MRIKVISFTKKGIELSLLLKEKLSKAGYKRNRISPPEELSCKLFTCCKSADFLPPQVNYTNESMNDFAEDGFKHYDALLYIGACGIAVRSVAPCVKDKFSDIPVLVMDEDSGHVIPILAGHLGGANRLAAAIAAELGSKAVITTATDLRRKFAVDLFAADNDLIIENREGIAAVSAKVLSGENVNVSIEGDRFEGIIPKGFKLFRYEENRYSDILISSDPERKNASIVLRPRRYVMGIGCKSGTSTEKIENFIEKVLSENGINPVLVSAVASLDIKKKEAGICNFARKMRIPFFTYDAETLNLQEGDFHGSDFVKSRVGVDNVCERAAMAAAGEGAELVVEKTAKDGITVAVAEKRIHIVPEDIPGISQNGKILVVGMGPGRADQMTAEAQEALEKSDVLIGYSVYLDLLPNRFAVKKQLTTPMKQEKERCIMAFEEAAKGQTVSVICSGDAGIYGMASLLYEIGKDYPEIEVEVIPGITAAISGAALLGAPINHDFCIISLSDLLTPLETIEKRIRAAAEGDFAIVIYNPSSKKRKDYLAWACNLLLETIPGDRACGYVKNIGREGTEVKYCTLEELRNAGTDMFTTVFIGNSSTEFINGKMVTKRGYKVE